VTQFTLKPLPLSDNNVYKNDEILPLRGRDLQITQKASVDVPSTPVMDRLRADDVFMLV